MVAVRVHGRDRRANDLALPAVVARGPGGKVDPRAAVQVSDGDRAGEVPAAVFVVQAVVGEADERLRRAAGVRVAGAEREAFEPIGEGEIQPGLVG